MNEKELKLMTSSFTKIRDWFSNDSCYLCGGDGYVYKRREKDVSTGETKILYGVMVYGKEKEEDIPFDKIECPNCTEDAVVVNKKLFKKVKRKYVVNKG